MFKLKYFLAIAMVASVTGLVSGGFYGNIPIAEAVPGFGWVDDGAVVRLETIADLVGIGTTSPGSNKLGVVGLGLFAGILTVEDHIKTGSLIATGTLNVSSNIIVGGMVDGSDISSSSPSWDEAYNERWQWSGEASNLNATTGRTSLGLGSLAILSNVSGGSGGTISDNTITNHDVATSTFWNITGVGAMDQVVLRDTDGSNCHKVTVNTAGTLSTAMVYCDTGDAIPAGAIDNFNSYFSGNLAGKDSGSGWGEAWQQDGPASMAIQTSSCQSGSCVKGTGGSSTVDSRVLTTSITNGTARFYTKIIEGSGTQSAVRFKVNSSDYAFSIQTRDNAPGDVIRLIGGSTANLGNYTEDTWQLVEVEFGDTGGSGTCAANEVRARLDGGSWSSPCTAYSNNGNITEVSIDYADATSQQYWIDELEILSN